MARENERKILLILIDKNTYLFDRGEKLSAEIHPEFYNKFKATGSTGLLGDSSLVEEVEKYYSEIVKANILLAILPTSAGIEEYQQLGKKILFFFQLIR
jgi:hypothetical protein